MAKATEVKKKTQKERVPSMGITALINSKKNGHKLAGVVRMFSKGQLLRDKTTKENTIKNRASNAGLALRELKDEEIKENEELFKAMKLIKANFAIIKDFTKNKSVKLPKELEEVYQLLLSFNKKAKKEDKLPDTITFG